MVAYGIQGDMVSYTVNYQDGGGNELAPSRTYYGAVGDKPVIAYQYIEGYRPDAYNLTKTLGKNEADNVFTFTYTQSSVQQPAAGGEGTEGGTDTGTPATTATPGTTAGGGAGTAGAGTATAAGTVETPTVENPDGGVPQATVDLDDEDTPKANIDASDSDTVRNTSPVPIVLGIVVAVIALGALIGTYVYFKKKHKADS